MKDLDKNINNGISWLGSLLQYIKEYGVINIIKSLFILILVSICIRICYNPSFIFDKYIEYSQKKHISEVARRSEYDKILKDKLPMYLYKYRADRVWIIQYHNGTMDWQHGTMRFEQCGDGIQSVKEQYNNFNLTWLNLPYYLKENEIFIGDLESLYKEDKIIYNQFEKNGTKFLACILMKDNYGHDIGIFGVTWENIPDISNDEIIKKLIEDRAEIKFLIEFIK